MSMFKPAAIVLIYALGVLGKDCKRDRIDLSEGGGSDDCPSNTSSSSSRASPSSTSPSTSSTNSTSTASNSTHDPTLAAPQPSHHPLDTVSIVALVIGLVVLVLLATIIILFWRRRRRRNAEVTLENGASQIPTAGPMQIYEQKGAGTGVGEKGQTGGMTTPATSVSQSESDDSSRTSRLRFVLRAIGITQSPRSHNLVGTTTTQTTVMSEARQGALVSVPGTSSSSSSEATPTPASPASSMITSTSVGAMVSMQRSGLVFIPENASSLEVEENRPPPPTYDSLMNPSRV